MEAERYKKSQGNAGQKGVHFQLDLVTVCLLNALNKQDKFWKISTENTMAGKFDDIVIELDQDTAVLIQAKHKDNKKITKDQLLSCNSKNADFSLGKYFLSYQEIKNIFQARTVIICTNTGINMKDLEDILTLQQAQPDSLLYYEGGCSFYHVNENILSDLKKSAEAYLRNNPRGRRVDVNTITEENLKDFLENLQIFSQYPCEHQLHDIIEQSLSSLSGSSLFRNISGQEVRRKVEEWFQQPTGEYLTEARGKAILCEIRSDKYCESLKDFNVSFGSNDLGIADSQRIVHVKITEGYLLQILKVYYALQIHKSKKLYVNPDDDIEVQKLGVEAFNLKRYKFLIMVWDAIKDETAKREISNKVKTILEREKYKQVILLADNGADLARQFGLGDISQIDGSLTLQDMSKDSQERLLKTQNVLFQGDRIYLYELLYTQVAEDYIKSLVDSAMLERVVRGKEIKVGVRPLDLDEDTARYYVSRRFETRFHEIGDARKILSEENLYDLEEKMTVISDCAGMGKSTVITKMAVAIKKTNPRLWIMKINLSDYTRILRDFQKTNKTKITAAELLNSRQATKMTNKFEELVFSMNKKVVLMLDGADEISPDYTQLVLSLLSDCMKAPNFAKIFVTTRPHVDLTQKEIGLFQMLPFSEFEQIEFLTNYWMRNLRLSHAFKYKCKQYAEILIHKVTSWTEAKEQQQHSFADIPLQAKMLADIFQENIKGKEFSDWEGCKEYLKRDGTEVKLPEKFNIAKLYDTFIEKKRDIFMEKASPDGSAMATPALRKQFESYLTYHRSLAVSTILPEDKQLFKSQVPEDNDTEEYILKIGIVQRLGDRVHFIHRTFAEYFLADSIVQELKLKNPSANFQRLLIDRIFENDEFNIVRIFLDVLLHKVSLPTNIFKRYKPKKNEDSNVDIIFKLASDGHVAILRLILESVDFKVIEDRSVNVNDWRLRFSFGKRNKLKALGFLVRKAGVNIERADGGTPLHSAVNGGHFDMVDFLVKQGADVNKKNGRNETALYLAAHCYKFLDTDWNSCDAVIVKDLVKHGADVFEEGYAKLETIHWDIIKYLVEQGADINGGESSRERLLHIAILHDALDIVVFLLKYGTQINMRNIEIVTALHIATYKGNLNMVKILVDHGADVNAGDCEGLLALHIAAKFDRIDIIRYFLKHQVDVNIKSSENYTALHMATLNGNLKVVKYLVQHGADINAGDVDGYAALHMAAKFDKIDIVKYLLEHGADINRKNCEHHPALHMAILQSNFNIIKYLVEHGADVNAGDEEGIAPLHLAAIFDKTDLVKFFHEHGADINLKSSENKTALHMAIRQGNWNIMSYLINHGADVNAGDEEGLIPLYVAAKYNQLDLVEYLLEHGADINMKSSKNNTVLHMAIRQGNFNTIKYLIKHGADVNARDEDGLTPLHMTVKHDEMFVVEYLLEHGADINTKSSKNNTVLHMAIRQSNFNTIKYLIEHGADVNAGDEEGLTPLHVATIFAKIDLVKFLLEHGADINLKSSENKTALHMAIRQGNWNIMSYLINPGPDVNAGDEEGLTPLHVATIFAKMDLVKFLLEHGADINIKSSQNKTALHMAIRQGNWNIMSYLINHGADVNAEDKYGRTVLHLVAEDDQVEIVQYLLEHGVDINKKDRNNITAFHIASDRKNWNVLKRLVEHGADVNAEDEYGRTVLHMVAKYNQVEVVKYLLERGVDINKKDSNNMTAFQIAHSNENWNVVNYLVEHGADVNAGDEEGLTPLHVATIFAKMDFVKFLLEHGADINIKSSQNKTALHMAIRQGNWNIMSYLINHGADVNAEDKYGRTVLHLVTEDDQVEIVMYLLEHGVDINKKDRNNITAFHIASDRKNWNVVKRLVEHGADVNAEDEYGRTVLHMVAKDNQVEIVKYFLERGVDINKKDSNNMTALQIAHSNENWNVVNYLVEHGADVNAGDEDGDPALHEVA